jgi:sugar phosphate isomerase/epimerase
MKLSVVTTTPEVLTTVHGALSRGSFAERLEKAVQVGCTGVELMALRLADLDGADIAAQVSGCGLEIAAIGSGAVALLDRLTLLSHDRATSAAAERRLYELIDFAAAARVPLVTIGGFRGRLAVPTWADRAAARAYLLETLHRAAKKAARAGVHLVLEPLNHYESDIVNTAAEGLPLIGEVGHSHLGLLLDTFHMNIEESTFVGAIEPVMAAVRLWHVHLGDSNRFPPGQGHIDFGEIVAALRGTGYTGYLSSELLPRPDLDAAAAMTIKYMRSVLGCGPE